MQRQQATLNRFLLVRRLRYGVLVQFKVHQTLLDELNQESDSSS